MFGFLTRWRDEANLERIIRGYEDQARSPFFTGDPGTLRSVVRELRQPTTPGVQAMGVLEVLSLISLVIQLIPQLQGIVAKIVAAIRARHQQGAA